MQTALRVARAAPGARGLARTPLIQFLGKRDRTRAAGSAAPAPAALVSPSAATGGATFEDIPLTTMRKVIASRLTESKVTVPHQYATADVRLDSAMALRKMLAAAGVKVSVNDLIIKAAGLALRDVPELNCSWSPAEGRVVAHASVDVSVAVATDAGLITPIVKGVDGLGLSGVSASVRDLAGRARTNELKLEEFVGGSFTISNLGMFGIDEFTAVVNPPQAAILAVARGRPVVAPSADGAGAETRTMMAVTMSSDRRVADEALAAQFLQVFTRYMEAPELMVV